jgi:hypothetical protein
MASGGRISTLDLSLAADQERAAMAYNKVYGSGNVYFGDPGSGTVEHFEAFMYAENNFYATNLDSGNGSGGTQKVEIYGNMTAGNQVKMARDTTKAGYSRVPLNVIFDPLIRNGGKPPPGLPPTPGVPGLDWHLLSWKASTNTAEADMTNEKDPR